MASTSINFDSGSFSRLIGIGYEAALNRSAWHGFADDIAAASGSQMAMIQYIEDDHPERSFLACGGLGNDFEETFAATSWLSKDDKFWTTIRDQPSGTVVLGHEIMPRATMRKSRDYARVARPWNLEHFLISSILSSNGVYAFLSLGRTARASPFRPGDKATFGNMVLPHLRRSLVLHRNFTTVSETSAMLSAVVDKAPYGLIVFDTSGRPVVLNREASNIFAAADGLTLINGRLHAANPVAHAKLESALSIALHGALGAIITPPDPVEVPRPGGKRPYQVVYSQLSLGGDATGLPAGSAVMAMIHQTWVAGAQSIPTLLHSTYNLTRSEIRLCLAMLKGKSLIEAGESLAVSRNTAKTHLARIFSKTGVHSQPALLRLLSLGTRPQVTNP